MYTTFNLPKTTPEKILDHIARFLFRYGFSSLTMEGAAAYAQISKRTLYKYYPNKEALLNAVLEFQLGRYATLLSEIVDDDSRASLQRLSTSIAFIADLTQRLPPVLLRDLLRNDRHYWEKVVNLRKQLIYPLFERLLLDVRKEGFIRQDMEPRLLTGLVFSIVEAVANPAAITGMGFDTRDIYSGLFALLLQGILSDPGRSGLAPADRTVYIDALEAIL